MPVVCIIGAVHLSVVNTLYPMSEEERRKLEDMRSQNRPSRSTLDQPVPARPISETCEDNVLTDKWAQPPATHVTTTVTDISGEGGDNEGAQ